MHGQESDPRMLAQSSCKTHPAARTCTGALTMSSTNRDRLDSYFTCTVSNQEPDGTAQLTKNVGASIKPRIKTRPMVCAPVHSLWLAQSAIVLTVSLLAQSVIKKCLQCTTKNVDAGPSSLFWQFIFGNRIQVG